MQKRNHRTEVRGIKTQEDTQTTRKTGYRSDSRRKDNVSGTIKGEERVRKIEIYCKSKNICVGDFLTELVDTFFAGEEFRLLSLSKEELVRMVLEGGKA